MQFLYPIGLFAIVGILVPIVIHLWNIKQRKTLKIGSIAFLGQSSSKSSRSFKIADWLLLTLRCLLIVVLAFLIAAPYIKGELKPSDKGWVLLEKNQFKNLTINQQKEIDSLLNKGFELHDFNIGFTSWELKDTVAKAHKNTEKLSYNVLIKNLNSKLPAGFKVCIYAENTLKRYEGIIPNSPLAIEWNTYAAKDSLILKVAAAYFTNTDSLRVLLMNSSPKATNYTYQNITNETKNVNLKIDSGISFLKTKEQLNWIKADTATLYVSIYEEQNQKDAAYLKAAILAIRDFSGRKISVQNISNPSQITAQTNLLFWLSDKAIPANISNIKGQILFNYEYGKEQTITSIIQVKTGLTYSNQRIDLFKRVVNLNDNSSAVWNDGFGKAILTYNQAKGIRRYRFYSRFNPQWTDLVWKEAFVKEMVPIVLLPQNEDRQFGFEPDSSDKRTIPLHQIFTQNTPPLISEVSVSIQKPINNWLWFFALLLFFLERIWSFNQKKA